ncbi:MAG: LPXTG cell wall anchor domain-containing protein [bacterium]|nr:LPXTG cell wall anchor domain-containing protein [bacterium]
MTGTILSILMLAGIALTGGGLYALVKKRDRKRGALMVIAGLVMFGNVAIMAMPVGDAPVAAAR